MIGLTALAAGLVIIACVVGFCFYLMLAQQKKAAANADEAAMALAKSLNEGDRVGQINNVISGCRELVYISRSVDDRISNLKADSNWQPLAHMMLEEARSANPRVETERKNQIKLLKKQLQFFASQHNLQTMAKPTFILPFWQSYDPLINDIYVGAVKGQQSNVVHPDLYPELSAFDQHEKYFQSASNLYTGNIDAKLPPPDNELTFKLAAVHAPVENSVSPPRLINEGSFKQSACQFEDNTFLNAPIDQIPTAIKVVEHLSITSIGNQSKVQVASYAEANGSQPPP
jgi:hypothetical protein